jgi:hypothetical protein
MTQVPAAHDAPAWANAQAWPHAPQFATSAVTATSHPFNGSWSQSAKPGSHAAAHAPATQLARAFGPVGHAVAQPPQWAGSVRVSVHIVPQIVGRAAGQPHVPFVQTLAPAHSTPQPPQLPSLDQRSVHAPSHVAWCGSVTPSQSSSTPLHATSGVPLDAQTHTVPRPGTPAHIQLLPDGQSVRIVQGALHRPTERQTPEAHWPSIAHGAPSPPGAPPSVGASIASIALASAGVESPGQPASPHGDCELPQWRTAAVRVAARSGKTRGVRRMADVRMVNPRVQGRRRSASRGRWIGSRVRSPPSGGRSAHRDYLSRRSH